MFVGAALRFVNTNIFIAEAAIIMKLHWVLDMLEELAYGGHGSREAVWSGQMQVDKGEEIGQSSSRKLVSHCKCDSEQNADSKRNLCPSVQGSLFVAWLFFLKILTSLLIVSRQFFLADDLRGHLAFIIR